MTEINFDKDKAHYVVATGIVVKDGKFFPEFRPTNPRPMIVESINLDGAKDADNALDRVRTQRLLESVELSGPRKKGYHRKLLPVIGQFHRLVVAALCISERLCLLHHRHCDQSRERRRTDRRNRARHQGPRTTQPDRPGPVEDRTGEFHKRV